MIEVGVVQQSSVFVWDQGVLSLPRIQRFGVVGEDMLKKPNGILA